MILWQPKEAARKRPPDAEPEAKGGLGTAFVLAALYVNRSCLLAQQRMKTGSGGPPQKQVRAGESACLTFPARGINDLKLVFFEGTEYV
jgi:hypothetical protein